MKLQKLAFAALTGALFSLAATVTVADPAGTGVNASGSKNTPSKTSGTGASNKGSGSQGSSNKQTAPSSSATASEPYVRPPS